MSAEREVAVTGDPHTASLHAGPVRAIPNDAANSTSPSGIALCLSGGGYRAMLFHLGSLWRLNELGLLRKLDRISSVSGGSITSAMLGLQWSQLNFHGNGIAQSFNERVVKPVRVLGSTSIDAGAI